MGIPAVLIYVPLVLVGIPAGVVSFFLALATGVSRGPMIPTLLTTGVIAALCFAVVYNSIRSGWTKTLLMMGEGEETRFSDIKSGTPWFVNFLVANMMVGIASAIGGFLLVVPGVFIAARTAFVPFLIIDENLGPIEAIQRSNELVTGYTWQIVIYEVLYFIAGTLASLIPIANIVLPVANMGYFDLALTRMYLQRKSFENNDD
jgi:uncharacterized membrane protein